MHPPQPPVPLPTSRSLPIFPRIPAEATILADSGPRGYPRRHTTARVEQREISWPRKKRRRTRPATPSRGDRRSRRALPPRRRLPWKDSCGSSPPRRGKLRSPLAIAQEIADLAWEAPRPQEQAELARQALSVSPDCADAYVILANQAASRDQARQLLEEGVAAGQRAIGSKTFETIDGPLLARSTDSPLHAGPAGAGPMPVGVGPAGPGGRALCGNAAAESQR